MIACLGKFDALHAGHRALVQEASRVGVPVLVGFSGMAEVLGWASRPALVAVEDRARVLAAWPGQPTELTLSFADVRNLTAAEFLQCLAAHGITGLVVGEDFRGGRNRTYDAQAFTAAAKVLGWTAAVVPEVSDEGQAVSSTRVREALHRGDVATATRLLGRPHRIVGTVVRGDGRGASLGIPTANLGRVANVVPATGVYAGRAAVGDQLVPAAINIGHLPTIGERRELSVEAHMIGWSGTCYDQQVGLDLIQRIRDECSFADLPSLVQQIRHDIASTQRILG